ncbi:MAG: hypothetical protein CSA86_03630 [Arcobacter sp.]|nr:MAG: hypothetical protein CSA86_03630 [Arcobacter sp.]
MKLFTKIVMTSLVLGSFSQVLAGQMYVAGEEGTLKAGKSDVTVFMGVPVDVEKKSTSLEGYLDGEKLFSSKNKALQIANVPKGTKTEKLANGKVKITGIIAQDDLSDDIKDVWSEQEEFYFESCTQCHAAHKLEEHTMNEWASVFGTMKGFAQLDDEEATPLLRFLQSNASNGLYAKDKK